MSAAGRVGVSVEAARRPEVSVLMPARNAGATLPSALGSVLRAQRVSLEVCVVDHASSDETPRLLASFAARDPRVRVIEAPPTRSLSEVLELGRRACRAPFIARMDADDLMHPARLAADCAALHQESLLAAVACRARLFPRDAGGFGMRAYVAWQNSVLSPEAHATEFWIEQPCCHPATTFRASVLEAVGGYREGEFPEDYDLFLRILTVARGQVRKRPLFHHGWRESAGRFTRTHPRASRDAFADVKARYLVPHFQLAERPVFIAGAGKEAGRISRSLLRCGVQPTRYFDVSPRRIGRLRYGVPVHPDTALRAARVAAPGAFCIGAVGTSGARGPLRQRLLEAGFREGVDAVLVA